MPKRTNRSRTVSVLFVLILLGYIVLLAISDLPPGMHIVICLFLLLCLPEVIDYVRKSSVQETKTEDAFNVEQEIGEHTGLEKTESAGDWYWRTSLRMLNQTVELRVSGIDHSSDEVKSQVYSFVQLLTDKQEALTTYLEVELQIQTDEELHAKDLILRSIHFFANRPEHTAELLFCEPQTNVEWMCAFRAGQFFGFSRVY